jgi:hypothetical protein
MTLYSIHEFCYFAERDVVLPCTLFGHLVRWGEAYRMSESDYIGMDATLWPQFLEYYTDNKPWILRNLTTKEYVLLEAVALKLEYIYKPNIDVLGFSKVVLSRICWSSSSDTLMAYDGNILRGVWARHWFDIAALARHEQDTKGDVWKDVSDEVITEIARIWESKYSKN